MTGRLEGKTAIITGAGSGFGRAAAVLFAREGARIVVADINGETADATAEMITSAGGEAVAVAADVSSADTAKLLVDTAASRFGHLDVLVNNAGINQAPSPTQTWDVPEETWDRIIRVNLRSVYVCCRAAVPAMRAAGRGSIVNVASIATSVNVGGAAYAASKGGMLSYTRLVAVELAPEIRVNCVSPGFMWTPMSSGERDGLGAQEQEARMAAFASYSPMRRAGSADDIARGMLYLASDESAFVTGRDLVIDGGHLVFSH
jgi:NAD(P)-dependent dehydrogenase (short-subunit alcohol dehydrogenase family)